MFSSSPTTDPLLALRTLRQPAPRVEGTLDAYGSCETEGRSVHEAEKMGPQEILSSDSSHALQADSGIHQPQTHLCSSHRTNAPRTHRQYRLEQDLGFLNRRPSGSRLLELRLDGKTERK